MGRQQQPRPPSFISGGGARSRRNHVPSLSHHALERQFLCFTFVLAFLSYAVLHTIQYHDSDSGDDINKSPSQNRKEYKSLRKEDFYALPPKQIANANNIDNTIDDDGEKNSNDRTTTSLTHDIMERIVDETNERIAEVSPYYSIPPFFTAVDEQYLHNGRVIRELSHRILSRNIAQSNVIIVSPNFHSTHVFTNNDVQKADNHSMMHQQLYYPAKIALEQGHTTHLLSTSTNLNNGWHSSSGRVAYNSTSIGWILLAYFSTQNLDPNIKQNDSSRTTIDHILSPELASTWLQQTTITYLVLPIRAKATIPLSSILEHKFEYEMDYIRDKTVEMDGLTAAKTLLDSNYKLQLLSSSHHFVMMDENASIEEAYDYGPNHLFQSVKALHRFLYERVTRVLQNEVNHMRQQYLHQHQHQGSSHPKNDTNQILEVQFHSLIFATQWLDLAIPSRMSYTDVSNHKQCKGKARCDPKLNARALNDTIFLECPKRHRGIDVQFVNEDDISRLRIAGTLPKFVKRVRNRRVKMERTDFEKKHGIMIDIDEKWLTDKVVNSTDIEVWLGSKHPSDAEAACVKLYKNAIHPRVSCSTRILPTKGVTSNTNEELSNRPNLLLIMIDPLSRQQLRRSLPNTWALLELLGYTYFTNYTSVGNNSGPNQAALYSGMPLGSRDGIRTANNTKRKWLWDRFNDAGYVTLKAEDGCVSNSNMVQSISPQTHHGKQLNEMFCFSYDRPNCLGDKLAAEHLVDYTRQFINTYNRGDENESDQARPWAAFISFIDSHEDTLTLVSYLDNLLVNFLQDIPMGKNTMILFTSDHGLHYGPTFASSNGEAERAQPLLYMRMPTFKRNQLHKNQLKFTTAYDVHETLVEVLSGEGEESAPEEGHKLGLSLLKPLPESRTRCSTTPSIPSHFCSLIDHEKPSSDQCNFMMMDPPSIFSYYSDIPQTNRPKWRDHCPVRRNHDMNGKDIPCLCSTNQRTWFDCSRISRDDFRRGIDYNTEHFSLRSCGHQHDLDHSLELDIHVKKNEQLVRTRTAHADDTKKLLDETHDANEIRASFNAQPNIIFLEIDSVSLSYSERHFPKTWGLLQEHKIIGDTCPSGWCSGIFNKTSVVGQNSIVNQLAALSGCIQYDDKEEELHHYKDGPQTHCPLSGVNSLGVDKDTGIHHDHWLFDVAKRLGYITFFGEEFCYEDSPYVVQTASAFTLDVDLTLSELYCNLAKDWINVNGINDPRFSTYSVEFDSKEVPDSCFDGKSRGEIGLEYISQIWDAYDSRPKFAFLNALAAHDYSLNAANSPLSAENYDTIVHRFLSNIMARAHDSRPTYIILRSDHGLQGGPYPIDYSTQIEHMHPWTAIIAPSTHQSLSIPSLASNQNRLVTGFDLYNSIRYLMSPTASQNKQKTHLFDSGIPRWSYNLFQQTIPYGRNCQDAKIPTEFCPCVDERRDTAPSFYVGHSEDSGNELPMPILRYDWRTNKFAAPKLPGVIVQKDTETKYEVQYNEKIVPPTSCNATIGSYIDEVMLHDSWQLIDNITSLYPEADISGGIFLYKRQTILLTYLVQLEIASRAAKKRDAGGSLEPFRVCETGFGSGHSAALFLSAAPNVEVVSFDKFERPYQLSTFYALRGYFGKRLTRSIGDSCKTVKNYGKQCDFLHGSSLCKTDNIDLINKAGPGVTLTSTAMNSLDDKAVYFGGKNAQWASLSRNGCIKNIICFGEEETLLDSKLYLAGGKEQKISHKFCFATNTGKCSSKQGPPVIRNQWQKEDFCPEWILPLTSFS